MGLQLRALPPYSQRHAQHCSVWFQVSPLLPARQRMLAPETPHPQQMTRWTPPRYMGHGCCALPILWVPLTPVLAPASFLAGPAGGTVCLCPARYGGGKALAGQHGVKQPWLQRCWWHVTPAVPPPCCVVLAPTQEEEPTVKAPDGPLAGECLRVGVGGTGQGLVPWPHPAGGFGGIGVPGTSSTLMCPFLPHPWGFGPLQISTGKSISR